MEIDKRFLNVLMLSFGFMLVFTAFQTMGNIEKTVLVSIKNEDPSFDGDGYTSLAIIYAALAICNWLAPSFISMTGPRVAIFIGACCYAFFIASFLSPSAKFLYTASAILGFGGSLIWTGHGQYLTENSDSETMSRNAGLFWAIFQSSLFAGNLFVYFMFTEATIDAVTRRHVFWVLTALSILGTLLLAFLRRPPFRLSLGEAEGVSSADKELSIPEPQGQKGYLAAWNAFKDALKLFTTCKMMLLSLTFIYTGLALTFFSGVYSSSIGFTEAMGEKRKSLVGLSGICIGIGEVVGGAIFGILASRTGTLGRCTGWPVVITGFFVSLFAYITILLNLPNNSPFTDTNQVGFINPLPVLAMFGSLTLGFGDACFNTQIYSLLGVIYAKESAPAFALFKFTQSVAAAISFIYSSYIGLHVQLSILFVSMILGTVAFCFVERRQSKRRNSDYTETETTLGNSIGIEG
ncbi:UNC93-like protein MFSD11 [Chelonus insularis]|uniref:UNC93-like protein MFSD11 n=1 Tax=Chelonus insularis TaxID=460826 RepID=UPI00158E2470|nr:UNC93-like protein MFSD11 [Chelonus insularis]